MTNTPEGVCPLTNEPARKQFIEDYCIYSVPSAGIKYQLTGSERSVFEANGNKFSQIPEEDARIRAQLAYWVYQQNKLGIESPMINTEVVKQIKDQPYPTINERIASYLLWLNKKCNGDLSESVNQETHPAGMVASCTRSTKELNIFILALKESGYLKFSQYPLGESISSHITLTLAGLKYCEELSTAYSASKEIFVAMWFDDKMNDYFDHIKEVLENKESALDVEVIRIDRVNHNNKIDDEIITHLKSCRLVIADFTCDNNGEAHRGGVYYEAGFAKGLNKNVIFTVREDCVDNLHFDTRQFNHIVWHKDGEEFLETNPNDAKKPKILAESIIDRIKAIEV